MTVPAAVTWVLAVLVPVVAIVSRLTDADQRWRPAVQAASFNELTIPLAVVPWALVDLLHLAGVLRLHVAGILLIVPPLAFVLALFLAGPPFTWRGPSLADTADTADAKGSPPPAAHPDTSRARASGPPTDRRNRTKGRGSRPRLDTSDTKQARGPRSPGEGRDTKQARGPRSPGDGHDTARAKGSRPPVDGRGTVGPEVALVTANVEQGTPHPAEAAADILTLDADVVVLQEYTTETQAGCRSAGLLDAYQHVWETPLEGWFGGAVLSRFRIASSEVRDIGDRPMGVLTLDVGRHLVTLVNVHVQAPIYQRDIPAWHDAFIDLAELAEAAVGPVVMAGDWNATSTHQPMRDLLAEGTLVDAHRKSHRVLPRTWPVGRHHPPLLCLDHVLLSPTIEVLGTSEVTIAGTDHRALCVGLRLPPKPT